MKNVELRLDLSRRDALYREDEHGAARPVYVVLDEHGVLSLHWGDLLPGMAPQSWQEDDPQLTSTALWFAWQLLKNLDARELDKLLREDPLQGALARLHAGHTVEGGAGRLTDDACEALGELAERFEDLFFSHDAPLLPVVTVDFWLFQNWGNPRELRDLWGEQAPAGADLDAVVSHLEEWAQSLILRGGSVRHALLARAEHHFHAGEHDKLEHCHMEALRALDRLPPEARLQAQS